MLNNTMVRTNIMIVDDTPANLRLLDKILSEGGYHVFAFPCASMALRAAKQNPPDLILMDINMPGMDGYEACNNLKNNNKLKDVPVIFISAMNEPVDKVRAFHIGGVDYVNKPFQIEEVLARVETHLKIYRMQSQLTDYNQCLQQQVAEQVQEITDAQLATILALAQLAQSRDDNTGQHLERVQAFSRVLSERLQEKGVFAGAHESNMAQNIHYACTLHDIGKVAIPDHILLKPGKLSEQEFELMKTHTLIGAENLQSVYEKYPHNTFIKMGIAIARWHHERWDGSGYPDGLSGEEIPLPARIMSLVDVYDALRSERPYKEGFSHQKARCIILEGSNTQFDPAIVQAFLEVEGEFERIFERYSRAKNSNTCRLV